MENSASKKNSILASMGLTKSKIEDENECKIDATKFIFNDRIEIGTKPYLCNKQHTIAILLIDGLQGLMDTWLLEDAKPLSEAEYYSDSELFRHYKIWDELKEYCLLESPKYFIYRKDFPMIVVYEKVAYIIAPFIDDDIKQDL